MSRLMGEERFPREFALHKKYSCSPHLLNLVWTHCVIVADLAVTHLKKYNPYNLHIPLVAEACLLHDVGVYQCGGFDWIPEQPAFDRPYAHHTIVGAWILYKEKYPPEVVQCALLHAGVGITADQITTYGLKIPVADYIPITTFQEFFTYICKFHSKAPAIKDVTAIKESLKKYGPNEPNDFQMLVDKFGVPDLEPITEEYEEWHKGMTAMITNLTSPTQPKATLPFATN